MRTINIFFTVLFTYILLSFSYSNIKAQDKTGVLVLAHGGDSTWNATVTKTVAPLKNKYPVEIAFGMANPKTMQAGIDKLENNGIDKIVVVPLFISSFSPIIRQNEYLLGLRDELADEPMIMDHSQPMVEMNHSQMNHLSSGMQTNNSDDSPGNHSDHTANHNMNHSSLPAGQSGKKIELYPLHFKAKIFLTKTLDDHPLVTEIIADRIKELSESPKNETVILVAHGPNDENDNKNWVKTMESIADKLREEFKEENSFRNIFCTTVRDDAPKEIYEMAKDNLRNIVRQASKDGSVIVVPLLLSRGGIEKGIAKRLEELNYKWNGKTLLPDTNITRFLQTSVDEALKETN